MVAHRFGVYLVRLDPTVGREIAKSRPCAVVSPDEINRNLDTVIIAPMTTAHKRYPSRVPCKFGGKEGQIALDQLRTVDRSRLVKHLGDLDSSTAARIVRTLLEMFG